MKCQKCGIEMRRVGLEQLSGENIFAEFECPVCHFRTQDAQKKPF